MNCINNPAQSSGLLAVGVNPIVAFATESREVFVSAEPLSRASSFVVYVLALFIFATLTLWVEGKIRLLCLAILTVFTLAFGGCIPQPSSALEALRSFKGSF